MRRVFISIPGGDQDDAERDRIMELVRRHVGDDAVEIPMLSEKQIGDRHPAYFLGLSIQMMSDADLVVFAEGTDRSEKCMLEHEVCLRYDMPFKYEWEIS